MTRKGKDSVQFSRSVVSDSFQPHESQHARPPCPSPPPWVHSDSWPSSRWCHPTISSSVIPFSSCLQSFPASGSFPMSHFFASDGQNIGVSASAWVLPLNIQDWFPLVWTGWISQLDLWLLIFLPTVLIPGCASSSPAFPMMYSAYKLNKQGDNIQPWRTPLGKCQLVVDSI